MRVEGRKPPRTLNPQLSTLNPLDALDNPGILWNAKGIQHGSAAGCSRHTCLLKPRHTTSSSSAAARRGSLPLLRWRARERRSPSLTITTSSGGAGVNTGTVPSKTLRETALALSGLKARRLIGVDLSLWEKATVGDFLRHEQHVKAGFNAMIAQQLHADLTDLYFGTGAFMDPHTVHVQPSTVPPAPGPGARAARRSQPPGPRASSSRLARLRSARPSSRSTGPRSMIQTRSCNWICCPSTWRL